MLLFKRPIAGLRKLTATAGIGAALCLGLPISDAHALDGCIVLPGTYLLTVDNSDGTFASRQFLTLTVEGNAIVDDSAEGGVTGVFNPFTTGKGVWECTSSFPKITADVTTLDFSLPGSVAGPQSIGRDDYELTLSVPSNTVSGAIQLRFFPLSGNPLVTPLPPPASTYTFTGVRVTN